MKNLFFGLIIVLFLGIVVLSPSCNNDPPPSPPITTYNYFDPIVNPPDTFQITFNISTFGDKFANVTFKEDAVWFIEKLGDPRVNYWVRNDTASLGIQVSDTLGLKAGYNYIFGANNNNYEEFTYFFTQFTKTAIEYETFESKF